MRRTPPRLGVWASETLLARSRIALSAPTDLGTMRHLRGRSVVPADSRSRPGGCQDMEALSVSPRVSANSNVPSNARLHVQVGGLDALDARAEHVLPRLRERPVGVDPARAVLDHVGGESRLPRVRRRPRDAEVGGQPDEEHLLEARVPPVAGEAGRRLAIRLDRKSTRLNSSHGSTSYAVFCLK